MTNRNDKEVRFYYELYNDAGRADSINEAFDAAQEVLKSHGLKVANDDIAERLVTDITRYVYDSGNATPDTLAS